MYIFINLFEKELPLLKQKLGLEQLKIVEKGRVKCLKCSKVFSCMMYAKCHYKNKHVSHKSDLDFICWVCNKGFAVKQHMRNHMLGVHASTRSLVQAICVKRLAKINQNEVQWWSEYYGED